MLQNVRAAYRSHSRLTFAEATEPERRLRLLEQVRTKLKTRYIPKTEEAYCDWIRRLAASANPRSPS